jgi:hypothetical protein
MWKNQTSWYFQHEYRRYIVNGVINYFVMWSDKLQIASSYSYISGVCDLDRVIIFLCSRHACTVHSRSYILHVQIHCPCRITFLSCGLINYMSKRHPYITGLCHANPVMIFLGTRPAMDKTHTNCQVAVSAKFDRTEEYYYSVQNIFQVFLLKRLGRR